eukprot:CAMPEP_0172408076 /NCGR_PEP_ID=MMETSP1061-20121228/75664_1 /TAXON_ID=37318 /ORGANISM="Pseudo-nitzschia pungens, Strain cf. pungens" /LENGTH=1396 /DNA_ID=CAMNT_0013144193 /DNA_START=15 /DNA_END=4201 /DNA_ORIENTATION=-
MLEKENVSPISWGRKKPRSLKTASFDRTLDDQEQKRILRRKTPEERKEEREKILNWIRNGKQGNKIDDDYILFSKIDQMLPFDNQRPQDRSNAIESVLDWARDRGVVPEKTRHNSEFKPLITRNIRLPEDRETDIKNITDWIRQGKPSKMPGSPTGQGKPIKPAASPTDEFDAIDQMLPSKKKQSPEDRAKDLEGVLNWMRSNDVSPVPDVEEDKPVGFDKVPSVPVKRRSPEDRKADVDDITEWIRQGKPSEKPATSPTDEFDAIDQMLPPKKKQSPEDRAKDLEGVLNWMRSNDVSPLFPLNDQDSPGLSCRTPEERLDDLERVIQWLRKGRPDDKDTNRCDFKNIDNLLPPVLHESVNERARDIESVLDWCRNHGVKPVDEMFPWPLISVSHIPLSKRSPEQRDEDLNDIYDWLRGDESESLDPRGEFKKVSLMLTPEPNQTLFDRASDIEKALDWVRNATPSDSGGSNNLPICSSVPITRRSPEDRINERNNIIKWIRQGRDDVDDPTGDFEFFENLLPNRPLLKPFERSSEIETAIDWARQNNNILPEHFSTHPWTKERNAMYVKPRSPAERLKDLDRILKWIRKGRPNIDNHEPTKEMILVDQLLPKETKQAPDDRAEEIEGVLHWMRQNNLKLTDDEELVWSNPVCQGLKPGSRSPGDRAQDLNDILTYLRNPRGSHNPELQPFETIDQFLPHKPEQSPENRAKEIERVFTWLRENNIDLIEDGVDKLKSLDSKSTGPFRKVHDNDSVFDRPGDIRSIPRDGKSPEEQNPEVEWSRQSSQKIPGVPNENNPFNKTGDFESIPHHQVPGGRESEIDNDETWERNPSQKIPEAPGDDVVFDRPGDIRSIPRDGKSPEEQNPEVEWSRQSSQKIPGVPDENNPFNKTGDFESIPHHQVPGGRESEIDNDETWERNPSQKTPEAPGDDGVFDRPGDVRSIPRDWKPKIMGEPDYHWARKPSHEIPGIVNDDCPLERVGDLGLIPHDKPSSEIEAILEWKREPNECIPGLLDDVIPFDQPDTLKSIPAKRPVHSELEEDLDWARSLFNPLDHEKDDSPFNKADIVEITAPNDRPDKSRTDDTATKWMRSPDIPGVPPEENDVYDKPGDLRSIPRDGTPTDNNTPEVPWARSPDQDTPGVPDNDQENIYNRPGDLHSIPRDGVLDLGEYPEMNWTRLQNTSPPGLNDEKEILKNTGDVKSIPRDGKSTNPRVPGVPGEDDIYDRPGDVKSIPRDGKSTNPNDPEMMWNRNSTALVPGLPNDEKPTQRPGDVRSIPRDGRTKSPDEPEYGWQRIAVDESPELSSSSQHPSFDWSSRKKVSPFNRPDVTTPFEFDDDFDLNPILEQPESSTNAKKPSYDWSAQENTGQAEVGAYSQSPSFDWSSKMNSEKPEVSADS